MNIYLLVELIRGNEECSPFKLSCPGLDLPIHTRSRSQENKPTRKCAPPSSKYLMAIQNHLSLFYSPQSMDILRRIRKSHRINPFP